MGSKQSKVDDFVIAATSSILLTTAGIALMTIGGPPAMIAGGIVMGAGVSGSVSATMQCISKDQSEFDYARWGVSTGIGAAGGAIALPISVAGGAIASEVAVTGAANLGITIGADMMGGAAANAGVQAINNKVQGNEVDEGLGTAALIGAVTGGVSSGAGQELGTLINTQPIESNLAYLATHSAGGAALCGTTGTLATLLHNIANMRKITKDEFTEYIETCGGSQKEAHTIWRYLKKKKYLKEEQFTEKCEKGIIIKQQSIKKYNQAVEELYLLTVDIWKDLWKSAATSVVMGGFTGVAATSAKVLDDQQQNRLFEMTMMNKSSLAEKKKQQIEEEERKQEENDTLDESTGIENVDDDAEDDSGDQQMENPEEKLYNTVVQRRLNGVPESKFKKSIDSM